MKGRNGANSRTWTESARASAARADAVAAVGRVAVGAGLHQFEVVVAERPEEPLGRLERPGVVVAVEGGRGRGDHRVEAAQEVAVEGCVTASGPGTVPSPNRPSTNLEALSTLMARRLPTRIWPVSTAVSVPGRPLAAQ